MLILFFLGSCIGSFINVVIDRYMIHKDFIYTRSECDHCHHQLSFLDLIPIFSYILLKGKCRYCHKTISFRNTFIEIISGLLFVYFILRNEFYMFLLVEILIIVAFIDLKYMVIPDIFILYMLLLSLFDLSHFKSKIIGAICISTLLMFMNLIKKDSFGGGDIKLFMIWGFILGMRRIIQVFYLSVMITAFYCIVMKYKKRYIPYGPFIVLSILIILFK